MADKKAFRLIDLNKEPHKFCGGSLIDSICIKYDKLVEIIGEPNVPHGDGEKTDCEWYIELANGDIITIYNWKNGQNYLGEGGYEVEEMDEWHVGGSRETSNSLPVELFLKFLVTKS